MPELEARLRALAADVEWPATPDLQAAVRAARPQPTRRPRWQRPRRVVVAALAALVLVPAAGAVAFPHARDDVLEFLGLRNVEVRRVPAPPPGARPELEDDLGSVVSLAQARRDAGFTPLIPAALGAPDRVRLTGQRISLVYAPRPGLPKLDGIDAGLILTQSRGGIEGAYLQKLAVTGTDVTKIRVRNHLGAFISGGPHTYLYVAPNGDVEEDHPLLAGPTLIWEQSGLVLRLEAAANREKVLQIARSASR
jgi:hypothetical protein